jgi:hypothetical protein
MHYHHWCYHECTLWAYFEIGQKIQYHWATSWACSISLLMQYHHWCYHEAHYEHAHEVAQNIQYHWATLWAWSISLLMQYHHWCYHDCTLWAYLWDSSENTISMRLVMSILTWIIYALCHREGTPSPGSAVREKLEQVRCSQLLFLKDYFIQRNTPLYLSVIYTIHFRVYPMTTTITDIIMSSHHEHTHCKINWTA